ncbi:MAG TPA: Gfo/Idh/MocA family oxidoreductase [Polyangia bacterium]
MRWAVVGQGHFAQSAILPAFAHARRDAELVALFSDDEAKRTKLKRQYKVAHALPYDEYEQFLRSGQVDAVYIALPNHLHREYTVRAAQAGVHVLCEKPMAVTPDECAEMMRACAENQVKLMIAYRLHLERATLTAVSEIRKGTVGEPRYLTSAFSFLLNEDNVRGLPSDKGGGPLHDIGTYCINAARYLLREEPTTVTAFSGLRPANPALEHTEEQVSAIMRFPDDRLASFTVSFGATDVGTLTIVGTEGVLTLDPAYSHSKGLAMTIDRGGKKRSLRFAKRDQVAAELIYFSDCVRTGKDPEPSGQEGMNDVTIIQALLESARTGQSVAVHLPPRSKRPDLHQAVDRPPHPERKNLVRVEAPH